MCIRDRPKVNLLVDIQAKLQAGKGAGYARWAKVFNLKQMAQTVNFLTEHHLLAVSYTHLDVYKRQGKDHSHAGGQRHFAPLCLSGCG